MVGQPALEVVRCHPGAPAHFEQLRQVKAIHSNDDEGKRQVGEAPQLRPENWLVFVLQCVIKHAIPLIEQHQHVHRRQVEYHNGRKQPACLPLVFRPEIGR